MPAIQKRFFSNEEPQDFIREAIAASLDPHDLAASAHCLDSIYDRAGFN